MPIIIPNVGDNVSLFHMEGDGSYGTYGVVKERDGDAVLVEETHFAKYISGHKPDKDAFEAVPIAKYIRRRLVNWLVHEPEDHKMYNIFVARDRADISKGEYGGISHCDLQILSKDFFGKLEEVGPVLGQPGA